MLKKIFTLLLLLLPSFSSAQTAADSLLNSLTTSDSDNVSLLPDKMPINKRILWGERGLLRTTGILPLTQENREREMQVRRKMLLIHQTAGYVTSALMLGTIIAGQQAYEGKWDRDVHTAVESAMGISYLATGILSVFSPPPLIIRRDKGFSNIKVHRALAYLHVAGMLTNAVFAQDLARKDRSLHRAIGYGTAASLFGAMIVMKF